MPVYPATNNAAGCRVYRLSQRLVNFQAVGDGVVGIDAEAAGHADLVGRDNGLQVALQRYPDLLGPFRVGGAEGAFRVVSGKG